MSTHSLALAAVAFLGLFSTACETARGVTPTGRTTLETYRLSDFDSIEISSAFQADITQDKSFRIEVEADEAAVPYLDVRLRNRTLILAMKSGLNFRNMRARATVTMPSLNSLIASGASQVKADGFTTEAKFTLEASGASRIDADLGTGDIDLTASGASHISLQGAGDKLRAIASGASHADLTKFRAQESSAVASGASSIKINTKGRLDAVASGASHITYSGNPIVGTINSSGASSIKPAN